MRSRGDGVGSCVCSRCLHSAFTEETRCTLAACLSEPRQPWTAISEYWLDIPGDRSTASLATTPTPSPSASTTSAASAPPPHDRSIDGAASGGHGRSSIGGAASTAASPGGIGRPCCRPRVPAPARWWPRRDDGRVGRGTGGTSGNDGRVLHACRLHLHQVDRRREMHPWTCIRVHASHPHAGRHHAAHHHPSRHHARRHTCIRPHWQDAGTVDIGVDSHVLQHAHQSLLLACRRRAHGGRSLQSTASTLPRS